MILVTGGAGFIGSWVVELLLEKGCEVVVLDNLSTGKKENLDNAMKNKGFKCLTMGDVGNKKTVSEMFKKHKPEICIHSAAAIHVHISLEKPVEYFRANTIGTLNILENARKIDAKVVNISTCMVYDSASSGLIDETHPLKPLSPYAGSKLAADDMVLAYYHAYGLPTMILRPFNVYGPRQPTYYEGENPTFMGVIPTFLYLMLTGKKLIVYGEGNQLRDFVYVSDVADFIVRATFSDRADGEIFNAGSGKIVKINELALMIAKDAARIVHVEHHHPQCEIRKLGCNYGKAKELLGWEPKTSLSNGIERIAKWIKSDYLH